MNILFFKLYYYKLHATITLNISLCNAHAQLPYNMKKGNLEATKFRGIDRRNSFMMCFLLKINFNGLVSNCITTLNNRMA